MAMENMTAKKKASAPEKEKSLGEIISGNLRELISEKGTTQAKLALNLGIAPATMTDYCKGRRVPGAEFFVSLKKLYGINIDDFLTKELDRAALTAPVEVSALDKSLLSSYRKYCGIYFMYYFDTSKYKGRDMLSPEESLMYGVLCVYEVPASSSGLPEYRCAAVMGIRDRGEATRVKKALETLKEPSWIVAKLRDEYSSLAYFGEFELSEEHVFISLYHGSTDKTLAIFHRVGSNKPNYTGGIGTANSASKGRERTPVIQFIGISRHPLAMSEEEIHHCLLLNYPSFKAEKEATEMFSTFRAMFSDADAPLYGFTDYQKTMMIRSTLEQYIRESLKRNMFRCAKISERDDDEWYHAIKNSSIAETE